MYVKLCNLSLTQVFEKPRYHVISTEPDTTVWLSWVEESFEIHQPNKKQRDMKDVLTKSVFLNHKWKWSWILFSETERGKGKDWFGGDLKFLCIPPFRERARGRGREREKELMKGHYFVGTYTTCREECREKTERVCWSLENAKGDRIFNFVKNKGWDIVEQWSGISSSTYSSWNWNFIAMGSIGKISQRSFLVG